MKYKVSHIHLVLISCMLAVCLQWGDAAASDRGIPAKALMLEHERSLLVTLGAQPAKPCQRPPDDYRKTSINGEIVNVRTLWMLRLASALYTGSGSPLRVVQGSYTDELDASFGTHAGGGVVDVSIRAKRPPHDVLSLEEANRIVLALRNAGFAAWLRLPDDLNPPTTLHIHAVAIGDRDLSEAASRQLYGPEGYFAGYDGIPPEYGGTKRDRHGGPITCQWMIDESLMGSATRP